LEKIKIHFFKKISLEIRNINTVLRHNYYIQRRISTHQHGKETPMITTHRLIGILFILAILLSIPLAVTAQESLQPVQIGQQRCFIIGIGFFHREHEDKIWVGYFDPWCVLYHGRFLGPKDDGFDLAWYNFRGFVIPINHCITPIFGRIDYYPREM
jgi:hypothetical protein